jgi:hypothetical protein
MRSDVAGRVYGRPHAVQRAHPPPPTLCCLQDKGLLHGRRDDQERGGVLSLTKLFALLQEPCFCAFHVLSNLLPT